MGSTLEIASTSNTPGCPAQVGKGTNCALLGCDDDPRVLLQAPVE